MKRFNSIKELVKAYESGEVRKGDEVCLNCYIITKKVLNSLMEFSAIGDEENYFIRCIYSPSDCKMDYNVVKSTKLQKWCFVEGKIGEGCGCFLLVSNVFVGKH